MIDENIPTRTALPIHIRKACQTDIESIVYVEKECFALHRQSSRRSICNSINSSAQQVYIAETESHEDGVKVVGVAIVFLYKRTLRIYSIAVKPEFRSMGVGESLLNAGFDCAVSLGLHRITLEADASNSGLINWYRKFGFEISNFLEDYYALDESAYRMIRRLTESGSSNYRTIIVVDDDLHLKTATDVPILTAIEYLSDSALFRSNNYHVINLCNSYKTHSIGYYVSLLASARNHRIIPAVMTFKDTSNPLVAQSVLDEIQDFLNKKLRSIQETSVEMTVIFGQTTSSKFSSIGKKLFIIFSLPLFSICLEKKGKWLVSKIQILSIEHVATQWPNILKKSLSDYMNKKHYRRCKLKKYKYDLAILVNENEEHPPSCPKALKKFCDAAEKLGFFVEFITKADKHRICEFDALFIRETTGLDNHTYSIARHAYTEGLVVIDDPWSILHCSNKVYLHERLTNARLLQPQGWLLTKKSFSNDSLQSFVYPLILKLPESSFSLGVFRVNNPQEMRAKVRQMFTKTDLILVQEYMTSDYDWRIGVLDNQPLFACKYYMANEHWQIYNWLSEIEDECSGHHDTVPISQVPDFVLKTALKAASLIGNGFYGVDLKEIDKKAYVIEVNDNPNVDVGVEDEILGDDLYRIIMTSLYNRIEVERSQIRYIV